MPPLEPEKVIVDCGTWVGSCGMGIHEFFLYLGKINSKVTVWFERKYTDDILNAYQFGEILGATPTGGKDGSFSFEYAPYDPNLAGRDEIRVEIVNNHRDSEWRFRVDCPEEYEDDPPVSEVKETESTCGRYHHQAGYAKKNTILLGDESGTVNVTWAIQGYAEVKFYQGDVLLKTIKSNRTGTFSFFYDPTKGPVYALTQGTGTVDYLFSCPYTPPEEIPEKFEFTCGDDIHIFQAPKLVNVILPPDQTGSVEIWFETESTVVLKFMQRDTLLYQVQQFEGSSAFSFDYDPANGPLTIVSENYGQFRTSVKCPYEAPPITPDPPKQYDLDCWDALQTFESPSEITVRLPNVTGSVLVTYVIPGSTELSFNQAGLEIGHGYPQDGLRSFSFNYVPSKGDLLVVATGTDDFQLWVDCPIPPPPPEYQANCGVDNQFDSPGNVNLSMGALSGNFNLTVDKTIALYNHSTLVASFTGTRSFFYTVGDQWKVVSTEVGVLNIKATCPSIKGMVCGPDDETFLAGDTILIDVDENVGDTAAMIVAPDTVTVAWYLDGQLFRSTTGTAEVDLYLPDVVEVKLISSGTGNFDLLFPCPVPRTPEGTCGKLVHSGTGVQADKPIRISGNGQVLITYELAAPRSITFATSDGIIQTVTGPVKDQFVYDYLLTEGPINVSFTGTGEFRYVIGCPPGAGEELVISPPDVIFDGGTVEDDPDENNGPCDDVYNTELEFVSDLTLPIPSAGTDCSLLLTSRAFSHPGMNATELYGATLMTAVRDITANNMKKTKLGSDFFFYYEFPLALEAEDYTFVLKASEADVDVAMYVNCYPVLDRARNLTLRETVTLFDAQTFVQIYWRYPDDITSQKLMTGGIYAAVVRTATNEVVWRSGDIMQKVRTNAKLQCSDKPRWPVTRVPNSEQVACPSGQTLNGVVGGVSYLTATWETITWSDGVVEVTEKVLNGVCKIPPTVTGTRVVNVNRQCPSGQTVGGVWNGTPTQTGSYTETTWSDGTKTNSDTTWDSFCAVPLKPAVTIVSQTPKVSVDACPSGQTKGGYIGGESFITGNYVEYLWSDGTKTYSEKTYGPAEFCALPTKPYVPPTIVSQVNKSDSKPCPNGQTVNGQPGGRTAITGTYIEYTWSDGSTTKSETTWEAGAVCQIIATTPESINPRILGPVYVGKPDSAVQGAVAAGTVLTPTIPTPYGSLNPVNAANYAVGMDDQYGAKRIVFSANKNTKPPAKDFYVSVPISLPISAALTTIFRVEVIASGVGVGAPMLVRQTAFAISKPNGRCSIMEIVPQPSVVAQPNRIQSAPASGMTAYDFAVTNKGGIPLSVSQVPANNPNACPLNKVNYSNDYGGTSLLFKVDTRQAGSGLAGFSFVVLNSVTGAVLYKSGQDGNIRITS
jgi:hypothetical protein